MIATPNGALVREFSPKKILNSGLGITAICPDRWQRVLKRLSVTSKLWGGDDSKPERDLLTCYCYWLLMLLPLRKPWFFVVPLVFGSHWFMDPIRFTQGGIWGEFLVKTSRKNVNNLSGRRSDAPDPSDFCEWYRIWAEDNYQGLLFCVCVCLRAACSYQSTSKHFLIGSGAEVTVYKLCLKNLKNLKCSSAPATVGCNNLGVQNL